jgi:PAS domain S-box-containing protein
MAAGKKNPGKKESEERTTETSDPDNLLRKNAEGQLARSPKISPGLKGQTPEQLVHELHVHQIELETQAEELRRAHLQLEESRDKYLDLYEFAPLGYLTLNDKALITEVNLTGVTLLGVERNKIINHGFGRFIAPGDRERWDPYFMSVRNHEEKQACTLMLIRGDGSIFPARLESMRIACLNKGTPTIRVAISDITDIHEAEKALRESEERYRLLLQNAYDMIFVHEISSDGPGKFLEVNDKICTTLGYTREELLAMSISDIDVPEQHEKIPAILKSIFSHNNVTFETEHVTKSGRRVPVEIHAVRFDLRGRPTVLSISRDISGHKQLVGALRETNKKLNLLSSITRHDINNQLVTINGFLELLHRKFPGDPEREDFFEKITNASDRINAMIQFTREYEKIGVNAPVWQDCCKLLDTAVKQTPLGNVTVKNDLPAGTEVFADPLMIKVCYNLMDNAVKHGGKITTIRFSAQERNGNHIVVCEDDGDGILAEDKERIFDRGFGKNTGLGLTLVREILDITGITIKETGEPGKGARFEITVSKDMWRIGKANRKLDFKDITEKELHEKPNPAPVPGARDHD